MIDHPLTRKLPLVLFSAVNLLLAFYLYAGCRTMDENIGLSARTMIFAAGCAALPLVFFAVVLALRNRQQISSRSERARFWMGALGCATLLGITVSELKISADEDQFLRQVESSRRLKNAESFSRPRSWPNESTSLLWEKSRGFWATD